MTEKRRSSERKADVVWILSYSMAGNHFVYEQLTRPGDSFARPVTFVRTALEKALTQQQSEPDQIVQDRNLCAVVLVVESKGFDFTRYCELVKKCAERVAEQDDFRLFVAVYWPYPSEDANTRPDPQKLKLQLKRLAGVLRTLCGGILVDTVHLNWDEDMWNEDVGASLAEFLEKLNEDVRASLAAFLEKLDDIRDTAQKKRMWNRVSVAMQRLAEIIQIASTIGILGAGMYYLLGGTQTFDHLANSLPLKELLAFIGGVMTIPLMVYFTALLFRPDMLHIRFKKAHVAPFLILLASLLQVVAALIVRQEIQDQFSWLVVGIVAGYLIDVMRRNGHRASLFFRSISPNRVTQPGHSLPQLVLDAINARPPFVLYAPIISEFKARVFISYTHDPEWSRSWAQKLYAALTDAVIACFLDSFSIKDGSCWRKTLNQAMGESNVILVLLNQQILDRRWPAAELEAALKNTRLAGVPDIFVLTDPALSPENSASCLPVFEAMLGRESSRNIPRISRLVGEDTVKMLVSELRTYRFGLTNAIVPDSLERVIQIVALPLKSLLFLIGSWGTIFGWIAILIAILQVTRLADVQGYLASLNLLAPVIVFLLCGFWAGFVGRLAVASAFEVRLPLHTNVSKAHGVMAAGFLILFGLWFSTMQPLIIVWGIVLAGVGWFTANAFLFHALQQKPGIRR